jgi:DNA-binding PadR family transcriptional regulator
MSLSGIEQQVLLATWRLRPNAYGVAVRAELERRIGKAPSIGAVYAALDRLEERGYVRSRQGEATAVRGGRRKLYFEITGLGQQALSKSLREIAALSEGFMEGAFA